MLKTSSILRLSVDRNCTRGLGGRMGIQSAQERIPAPVPSDEDEEEVADDQRRLIRRFRKGGWPSTALGLG
jgi:hypothetical protein